MGTPRQLANGTSRQPPARRSGTSAGKEEGVPTPSIHVFAIPSPYLRRTCAASSSDFVAKSEHEAAQVRRRYGEGTEEVLRIGESGDDPT